MKKLLLFLAAFIPVFALGQSQNPPSLKWKQIQTKHFNVIFNPQIENYARMTAAMMDSFYNADTKVFIDDFPPKVDLLLYNHSSVSNAYAALGPRRMVWYLTPPATPSFSLSPWNKMLGIHEFRHITQFSQMNDGFTQLGYLFFGQYGWMGLSNWAFPNWFFEGDAVFNETKYSNSGRGRMASFALPLRAIYLNGEKISYEKALFRSYKTYYPNHYYLGYHMVSYINRHYGEDVWRKIIYRTDLLSFWPYSFERSIKKYTGYNVRKTYKKAVKELDSVWSEQLKNIDTTKATFVKTKRKRVWTNYFDPQVVSKDTILAIKSGLDDNAKLVYLINGKEKTIREISGDNITYSNGLVAWTSYNENIRFGEESFSDVVLYNLKTKKIKQITKKGKYRSPEFSHKGDKIAVAKFGTDLKPEIDILDLQGNVIFSYKGEIEENFMMPVWTPSDSQIIFLKLSPKGESMEMLNLKNKSITTLITPEWIKFDKPFCIDNYVIFNYDYSGITNIYALDLRSNQIYQVTSRPFAAIQAVVDKKDSKLYFTDYNLKGLSIAEMPYNPSDWEPIQNIVKQETNYFMSPKTDETIQNIDIDFAKAKADSFKVKDYKPVNHLLNFHSWMLAQVGTMSGIQLYSDDILNTTSITATLAGELLTGSALASVGVNFKKYFPVFSFSITSGRMGQILDNIHTRGFGSQQNPIDSIANWNLNSVSLGVSIPLNLSKYMWKRSLNFSLNTDFSMISNVTPEFASDLNFNYSKLLGYNTTFSFSNRRYMAYRDLLPKFGQSIDLGFYQTPKLFELGGYKLYAKAVLYLPSVMKHDGFKIGLGYESKNSNVAGNYVYQASVSLPRGYAPMYFEKIKKISVDYTLPLFYPDLNIPYIIFIKRVRADLFYDYADVANAGHSVSLQSAGLELKFDFNLLRMNYITFNAGIRVSYLIPDQKTAYQGLFLDVPLNL